MLLSCKQRNSLAFRWIMISNVHWQRQYILVHCPNRRTNLLNFLQSCLLPMLMLFLIGLKSNSWSCTRTRTHLYSYSYSYSYSWNCTRTRTRVRLYSYSYSQDLKIRYSYSYSTHFVLVLILVLRTLYSYSYSYSYSRFCTHTTSLPSKLIKCLYCSWPMIGVRSLVVLHALM